MTGNDEQVVVDVIDELVASKSMFTAFDITKLVRARLPASEIFHSDIRRLVRNYDFPVGYGKTPISIPGININPLLYHVAGSNVRDYAPLKTATKVPGPFTSPTAPTTQPSPNAAPGVSAQISNSLPFPLPFSDPNSVDGSMVPNLDNRGRYCVRAKDIAAAGLGAADEVLMLVKNGEIELLGNSAGTGIVGDSLLTVDAYNNLRIFKTYFDKAFGHVPSKIAVVIDVTKRSIKIREA